MHCPPSYPHIFTCLQPEWVLNLSCILEVVFFPQKTSLVLNVPLYFAFQRMASSNPRGTVSQKYMRLHYEFETLINLGTPPFFFDSTPQIVKLFGLKYIYSPFVDIGLNFSSLVLMTLSSFLLLDQYWEETSWRPSLPCLHLSSPFHLHTHFFL